jgi:6-phosphofructokinase 1
VIIAHSCILQGGSELGTNRKRPKEKNIAEIAQNIEKFKIDILVMFGGYDGYVGVLELQKYKTK